mmetsp:Transcript_43770/g.95535  ORF Transcript_43770/g.95535 Transcript_43770/m.95535 type:complete len:265 (+) Transcript_43770:107-901(+)
MSKAMTVASLGLVAYGAGRAFVPALQGPAAAAHAGAALRGAVVAEQAAATGGSALPLGVACASGVLAVAAVGRGTARRSRGVARQAAKEPAAKEPTPEVETPPPPPPFNPASAVGNTAPLGFFDPLGFAKVGDEAGFRKLRSSEIKHGRVAMMAAVGAVVQHYVQLPGFENIPKGLGAVTTAPGTYGFVALFLISGVFELLLWKDDDAKEVGDYGNPLSLGAPLGWSENMRNGELNNGRAAMFAAVGIIVAELATGKDAVEQLF